MKFLEVSREDQKKARNLCVCDTRAFRATWRIVPVTSGCFAYVSRLLFLPLGPQKCCKFSSS